MPSLARLAASRTVAAQFVTPAGEVAVAARRAHTHLEGATVSVSFASVPTLVEALLTLDGVAEAVLLLSAQSDPAEVARLLLLTGATAVLSDRADLADAVRLEAVSDRADEPGASLDLPRATRWLVTTSGTSGLPKVVTHSLDSLRRSVRTDDPRLRGSRWGLLYDPTRFAGLQVLLQALLGDGRLLVPDEPPHDLTATVDVLVDLGVDHLSATPSLWRRLLMHPRVGELPLRQVTLGGETADESVLRGVALAFPAARISHVYASTEVGVGFTVTDGLAGFPADYLAPDGFRGTRIKVVDGLLWLRPDGPVATGVGTDADGFVCSGDLVEVGDDRVHFLGRAGGGVNVGGVTVHPDQVEAVLHSHPRVRLARVSSRPSRLTGALLVAEVVPDSGEDLPGLRKELAALCRGKLVREAVPARISLVQSLSLSPTGKAPR